MKVFYADQFELSLPSNHRFPMEKYRLLRQRVVEAGLVSPEDLCVPCAATDEQITRVHDAEYLRRLKRGELTVREIRRLGFPWSLELVERSRRSCGGTIEACRAALSGSPSVNLAGGTHHAFPDHGKGYCVFNDSAIAARAMQAEGRAQRVIILDCDVHQGDGTAAIFADDQTVFTFSIHGAKNFPFRKQRSDIDLELEDGSGDAVYLGSLEMGVRRALEMAAPDVAIYLAGADPFVGDRLGRLAMSKEGLAERDRTVFRHCKEAGVPVAVTMAGGYARKVQDTVDIHFQTVRIAAAMQGRCVKNLR